MLLFFILIIFLTGCPTSDLINSELLYINAPSWSVQTGGTIQFNATVTPISTETIIYIWSVSDTKMGTINDSGLFTANNRKGSVTITCETNTGLNASKVISIYVGEFDYLKGYTIKIAQTECELGKYDVFINEDQKELFGYYDRDDREAKQNALREVENYYNCTIEFTSYPADATWGPCRWSYIINRAMIDEPEYDFYVVSNAQIADFVKAKALVDLTDWYNRYGDDITNSINKTTGSYQGKVYSINTSNIELSSILSYNYNLWKEINEYDSSIEEPAKLFNDGKWSYSEFETYCIKVQTILDELYPSATETTVNKKHYVLSGSPTAYWVNMLDRNGKGSVDLCNYAIDLSSTDSTNAANTIKNIYASGAMDPSFTTDQNVESWNNGKALFNIGKLSYINNSRYWSSSLWGEGTTSYGYVPFPAPDGYDTDHIYVGYTCEEGIIMAAGREKVYDSYDIDADLVFSAVMYYFVLSKEFYQDADDYDPNAQITLTANQCFEGSSESMEAYKKVAEKLKTDVVFDPLVATQNQILDLSDSEFALAVKSYVNGTGASTWTDAVGSFENEIEYAIIKAFG